MKIKHKNKSFDFVNAKFIFTLLFSFLIATLYGQIVPQPQFEVTDNTVYPSAAIDVVIEDLDLSDVTSNILYDRGWQMGSMENFDGTLTSDTVSGHDVWLRQYGNLVTGYRGSVASSPVPSITSWKAQRIASVSSGKNPLVIMHIDYQQFLTDSVLLSTLIYESNGKLQDYASQSTSPFEDVKVFSFSPYLSTVYDSLSLTFETDPLFLKSNYGSPVATIGVDFDNGSGYQSIGTNGNIKVDWSTFGKKILKLKITYANAQTFYAKSTLHLIETLNYRIPGAKSDGFVDATPDSIQHPTELYHGAQLYIDYACGNDRLLKPYIYVEGFDPKQWGNQTLYNLHNDLIKYQDKYSAGYQLLNELSENGYDIVYVDFQQGSGDIIKNAETLGEVIKWVNARKAINNSTEPNVVVGFSMGGLIARLGIRYLELDNIDPEVSHYISWDTPHLGANIPLALRLAVDDLFNLPFIGENMGDYSDKLQDAYDVMNSPAARQMVLYSFDDFDWDNQIWNSTTGNHFSNELYLKGFPQTCENIAIAKGNGIGAGQNFGSLDYLLKADIKNNYSCFDDLVDIHNLIEFEDINNGLELSTQIGLNALVGKIIQVLTITGHRARIKMDIKSMPSNVPESYKIYERKIRFTVLWVVPVWHPSFLLLDLERLVKVGDSYPYDSCPGSTYDISDFSLDGFDVTPLLNGTYAPCIDLRESDFCFIPTFSALDAYDLRLAPYTSIDPVAYAASNPAFEKCFILDPSLYPPTNLAPTNETHTSFTPSNIAPFEEFISPDYSSINQFTSVSNYFYNLGANNNNSGEITETTDRITANLVLSGDPSGYGVIGVNCGGPIVDFSDNTYPNSNILDFSVYLSTDCETNNHGSITVQPYGSILIGETTANTGNLHVLEDTGIQLDGGAVEVRPGSQLVVHNCGEVSLNSGLLHVREGGKLIIRAGGELMLNSGLLQVDNGGEVIIKSGGKLIYEDGAQIELNGNDAVLSLGGLTHIGNDATFTFTYQGTESGYIRMLEEGYWGPRFSAGLNTQFKLKGENDNDLIFFMEENADFWEFNGEVYGETYQSHIFDYVEFKDGKIVTEDGSRIVLQNESRFIRCTLEGWASINDQRGIVPLAFCDITHCTLNNMLVNAELFMTNSGYLYISSSELNGSTVRVNGYGYKVRYSDFNNSYISSGNGTMSNSIIYSNFTNAAVEDYSDKELFITKSEFTNCGTAVYKEYDRVTLKCSVFENNGTGITGGVNSNVNLSTLYNGGYNYFDNNDYNIVFENAHGLMLEDGFNELYDANIMNIYGILDLNSSPCPPAINASNNIWTPLSDNSVPNSDPNHPDQAEFNVIIGQFGMPWPAVICQIGFNFGQVAQIARCGEHDDPRDPIGPKDPLGPKSNDFVEEFPLLTTPTYFTNKAFDYALKAAAFTTSISDTANGNDLVAADKYYELLHLAAMDSVPSDSMSLVIEMMRWSALNNYKATIERLFADSVLVRSDNQISFEPVVQDYVTVLMAFTDSVKSAVNYNEQFQLELWKSSLFSTIGKQEKALQLLSNINFCEHDSVQKIVLLEQIQRLEFNLMASQMEDFLEDSITFVLDSSIYQIPLESYIDTSGFGSYIQSPNSILYSSCNTFLAQHPNGNNGIAANAVIYPNPTQNDLNISILNRMIRSEDVLVLHIYELTGKEIYTARLKGITSQVELPDLANALYIYHIDLNNKLIDQGKISILK